jgi:hypothetical protein
MRFEKRRGQKGKKFKKTQKETQSAIRKNVFSLQLFIGGSFSFAFPR